MHLFHTIQDVRDYVRTQKSLGKSIALIPTMGALHEGHLTLVRTAKNQCDIVIVSVFVNPTQFGPNEDYDAYPRTLEADCMNAEKAGASAIFAPSPAEMYPDGFATTVNVSGITDLLCGAQRPGHFAGVALVVTKLFNIIQPDRAFFGQKDAQQVLVIRRFTHDLNIPVEIVTVSIVRDENGLALSSRNQYLSAKEKSAALVLSRSLKAAEEAVRQGEVRTNVLTDLVVRTIEAEPLATIDYVHIYAYPSLEVTETIEPSALLALAVRIGTTRLIDNTILEVSTCS